MKNIKNKWLTASIVILIVSGSGFTIMQFLMNKDEFKQNLEKIVHDYNSQKEVSIWVGSLNKIPMSIPYNYLRFPIEYVGETVWDPGTKKGGYTYKTPISNFSVLVKWPSMMPRNMLNTKNGKPVVNSVERDGWISISVMYEPEKHDINYVEYGLSRVLKGYLDHHNLNIKTSIPGDVRYQAKGEDPGLGLEYAVPVGPDVEKYHLWNKKLYWVKKGEKVNTLISCQNGEFGSDKIIRKCRHDFFWKEMRTFVNVEYAATLLPQWKSIETKSRNLIISFENINISHESDYYQKAIQDYVNYVRNELIKELLMVSDNVAS